MIAPALEMPDNKLSPAEKAKREGLRARKPYIADKLAKITEMEARGEISPIIRLEKSYLCNFQCTHCSAEYYMDRHKEKVFKIEDTRRTINLDDIRELSRQADELGLARFVITGGEPLVMRDFDAVVAAIDPEKHYVITDTNGWFLDKEKALHLKSIGVEKVQLSLDSFIEQDHDKFRNKPGSYKRVMRAIDASLDAGLNLLLSTVLIKGRAKTQEFLDMCKFATEKGVGLYVSYAKPTGSCSDHPEFVIDKEDADILRELEKDYTVFTHMTPAYGSFKGCITVKGIITVTSTFEVTPCPYIDMSLGNLRETSLKEVLARGMRNPWLGPYRPDCIIGEDPKFIKLHAEKTEGCTTLPVPWGQGFSDSDCLDDNNPVTNTQSLFDEYGRCIPVKPTATIHPNTRRYFLCKQPKIDYSAIYAQTTRQLGAANTVSAAEFKNRAEGILTLLRSNPDTANITKGVGVPFLLPKAAYSDIGQALEEIYLPAVEKSFIEAFPKHSFVNHHKDGLAGKLSIATGSRHQQLIQAMQQSDVVGYYFPALTEYSVSAAIEQIKALPSQFFLAGGFDTAAALIGCPDLLLRTDGYPPLLWLAALLAEAENAGYHFEAYGYNLTFNRRPHFNQVAEYWASGLVVLG